MKITCLIMGIFMLIGINNFLPSNKYQTIMYVFWIICATILIIIPVVTYGK